MSNEIKVGDTVRVSRDIPQFYLEYNSYRMFEIEHRVVDVNMEDGFALLDSIPPKFTTILPTKYLVKVDAEAKEAKFKVGDIIDTPKGKGTVHIAIDDYCVVRLDNGGWFVHMETNIPYAPCTEPTEQTEAQEDTRIRQMEAELDEFRKAELDRVLHPEKYYTYEVTIDNVAMNRQKYEADLAKEVALKVANKYNDPEQAAEYAVSVAKAVVEGLKRK